MVEVLIRTANALEGALRAESKVELNSKPKAGAKSTPKINHKPANTRAPDTNSDMKNKASNKAPAERVSLAEQATSQSLHGTKQTARKSSRIVQDYGSEEEQSRFPAETLQMAREQTQRHQDFEERSTRVGFQRRIRYRGPDHFRRMAIPLRSGTVPPPRFLTYHTVSLGTLRFWAV